MLHLDPTVNDTTRRYPRDIPSAFGPHSSRFIEEPPEPPPTQTESIARALILSVATVAGVLFFVWLLAAPL